MIERYTIKFGPAVSQKELEKALNEGIDSPQIKGLHKLKARLELICDYKDLHIPGLRARYAELRGFVGDSWRETAEFLCN
jgi:hypothetical protein